jgi:phospholipid/cholesterol/gamma-HCH transport system ATP-binding protein
MEAPVRFIDAFLEPFLSGANRAFEAGSVSEIATGGEYECAFLVKVFAGLVRLHGGKIVLLGHDLGALSRDALGRIRSRMGIVHPGGGLISNLKVFENVTLPLLYHSSGSGREIGERAIAALERLGWKGNLFDLPGSLSTFQRRTAGFARVIAMDPEVVVYDRLVDGLYAEERDLFLRTAFAFHKEKAGRVTFFVTSRPGSITGDEPSKVVHLTKGRFE